LTKKVARSLPAFRQQSIGPFMDFFTVYLRAIT